MATGSDLEPRRVLAALAALLPDDLSARAVSEAPPGFDARRDARARRYEYRVLPGPPSALRRGRVLVHPGRLDRAALDDGARRVVGRHDFRAFTPTRTEHVFFDRTVTACAWGARGDELVLTVEADAFLRHMVRVLVGHPAAGRAGRVAGVAARRPAARGPARRRRTDRPGPRAHARRRRLRSPGAPRHVRGPR